MSWKNNVPPPKNNPKQGKDKLKNQPNLIPKPNKKRPTKK